MPARKLDSANANRDDAFDPDAHQPRGILILHNRKQRLAVPGMREKHLQCCGQRQADQRNERLQILDSEATDGERAGRQDAGRHAARILAEGE